MCVAFVSSYFLSLSDFDVFFAAKKKHTMVTASAKRSHATHATLDTVEDVNTTDTEANICTRGNISYLVTCDVRYINYFLMCLGKKKMATLGNPQAVDADGLLVDVDVQQVNDNPTTREDKWQDVDQFFHPSVIKDVNGKSKKYRMCKLCQ